MSGHHHAHPKEVVRAGSFRTLDQLRDTVIARGGGTDAGLLDELHGDVVDEMATLLSLL